jgi:hypothetical protein
LFSDKSIRLPNPILKKIGQSGGTLGVWQIGSQAARCEEYRSADAKST